MSELNIPIKFLHPDAKNPTKSHFSDGGWDLYCVEDAVVYDDGRVAKVKTGIAISIPVGWVGLLWDRSGMAIKHGIHRVAGVIDASYRGEIIVGLSNLCHGIYEHEMYDVEGRCITGINNQRSGSFYHNDNNFEIKKGDRIAQLLIQEIPLHVTWEEVEELGETERGKDGFGSTGK